MNETSSFKLPGYARFAFEVVHSMLLDVWFEGSTRWLRIDVLKDLVGNYQPYSVRIFSADQRSGEFLDGEYPYWTGSTPEKAVEACFAGLSELAGIKEGIETKGRLED